MKIHDQIAAALADLKGVPSPRCLEADAAYSKAERERTEAYEYLCARGKILCARVRKRIRMVVGLYCEVHIHEHCNGFATRYGGDHKTVHPWLIVQAWLPYTGYTVEVQFWPEKPEDVDECAMWIRKMVEAGPKGKRPEMPR